MLHFVSSNSGWFVFRNGHQRFYSSRRVVPTGVSTWLRRGGFRTAELNLAGWGAVLVPGIGTGLGLALHRRTPWWSTVLGCTATSWLVALGFDFLAWRRTGFRTRLSDQQLRDAAAIVERLRSQGVPADLEEVPVPGDSPVVTLRSTNRHRRAVVKELDSVSDQPGRGIP
jgi:hypothetical protein